MWQRWEEFLCGGYSEQTLTEMKNKDGCGSLRWSGKPVGGQILESPGGQVKYLRLCYSCGCQ